VDYSPRNQLLLASYGVVGPVAGSATWALLESTEAGRTCAVRSGEHGVPVRVPVLDDAGVASDRSRTGAKSGSVAGRSRIAGCDRSQPLRNSTGSGSDGLQLRLRLAVDATKFAVMAKTVVDGLGPNDGFRAVIALRSLADDLEAEHVVRALGDGWSWARIAEALDVSRQAVQKKHGHRINATR
jgi:hypothetical protein